MGETSDDLKWLKAGATADELLVSSYTRDQHVLAAVARHPNAPASLLARLAADFPAEVLSNPALPLLRLAQPQLLSHWPREALLALLRLPQLPGWVRQQTFHSPAVEVQVALATLPQLSEAELLRLSQHPSWLVRARVAARDDLPGHILHDLLNDRAYGVRLALAYRSDLPEAGRERLAHDSSRFVRQALRETQARAG